MRPDMRCCMSPVSSQHQHNTIILLSIGDRACSTTKLISTCRCRLYSQQITTVRTHYTLIMINNHRSIDCHNIMVTTAAKISKLLPLTTTKEQRWVTARNSPTPE